MCSDTDPRTFDALHRCLEHPLRRAVLCALTEQSEEVTTLEALVESLEDRLACGKDRLRVELHHVHLPKLSTLDAVEFDYRSGDVRFYPESSVSQFVEQELSTD